MNPDDNNPDTAGDDDRDAVVVPLPSKALDSTENMPQTGSDQLVWWYDQKRKRGGDRTYSGHVNHIHGAHAERRRGELADVIRGLLDWAAQQQADAHQSTEDGEAA